MKISCEARCAPRSTTKCPVEERRGVLEYVIDKCFVLVYYMTSTVIHIFSDQAVLVYVDAEARRRICHALHDARLAARTLERS